MSEKIDNLFHLLKPFGLTDEEAQLYLVLLKYGALSALEISRSMHVPRTKVYRILDRVKALGVVVQKHSARGFSFEAASPTVLELMVTEKEREVEGLRQALPTIVDQLRSFGVGTRGHSKVLYYEGKKGLEHMTYNSLRAKDGVRIYEMNESMTAFVDKDFAERMRQEIVRRQIHDFQLTNSKHIKAYTNVNQIINFWNVRYIEKRYIDICFEVLIYNDIYCMYAPIGDELFGVEIYNERLARMQKQLFELAWKQAQPLTVVSNRGEAILKKT